MSLPSESGGLITKPICRSKISTFGQYRNSSTLIVNRVSTKQAFAWLAI